MKLSTALRSRMIRIMASERLVKLRRAKARAGRALAKQPPKVHYFHQVSDPYSHMTVQKLLEFAENCQIPVEIHLVSAPLPEYQGDQARFVDWALRDAHSIASGFGVQLGTQTPLSAPDKNAVIHAENVLAELITPPSNELDIENGTQIAEFAIRAITLGNTLWNSTPNKTSKHPPPDNTNHTPSAINALAAGNTLRTRLGHYQGAMFYFDGEWYWGLDRLHLLEARLQKEGFRAANLEFTSPVPPDANFSQRAPDCSAITLEYFPSLRSPYTAIGHSRVLRIIEHTGVKLELRPVMPMLMRGVPAPRAKQQWIISDAAREARYHQVPFGNVVDPFGEPVKRAFALFPSAARLGKGMEFTTAYLAAAWAEGTDITSEQGLAQVAEQAGLDFFALTKAAENDAWEALLTDNVNSMLGAGLWGVPSFRVSGGSGPRAASAFACWGQDRLWRVTQEVIARA